jgi:hypothetical protein
MSLPKTNRGLNPNPATTPRRKEAPLQRGFDLDSNNAVSEIKKVIRQQYTTDITADKSDYVCKAITKPVTRGEGALATVSVRGRARNIHDYLPIMEGPPSEDTTFGRLQICKAFLHPEFSSTQANLFSSLEPGSEFLGDLQYPKSPLEFYNGTIKSNYTRGVDIAGLTPSSAFKVCSDFIQPSSVTPATGKADAGSQNPGSTARTAGAISPAQLKQKCNTIYRVGDFKLAGDLRAPGSTLSSATVSELGEFIASHEGFIPQVREDWDYNTRTKERLDSAGYGSVVDDSPRSGGSARRAKLEAILQQTRPRSTWGTVGSLDSNGKLKAVPKSAWSKYGKRNYSKVIPGDYTIISPVEAQRLMVEHDIAPTVRKFLGKLNKDVQVTNDMIIAVVSASYQCGARAYLRIARVMNRKGTPQEIYSAFLSLTSDFRKRRMQEAEFFFGNKNFKYTDKDKLRK